MIDKVVPIYSPDYSAYNALICPEGQIENEFEVVKKSAYTDVLQDMLTPTQVDYDFDPNLDLDDSFDSILPKEIQSQDEIYDYMNYLQRLNDK